MQLTSVERFEDDVRESAFSIGEIPGIRWTPGSATARTPAPLILLGHPGGLSTMHARLAARARAAAAGYGFASAAIELPGSGDRPRSAAAETARADLRRAMAAGQPTAEIVERLIPALAAKAVPELQITLDHLLALPEISGPAGYAGGVIAIGVQLALVEPRIAAAVFFAGSFVPAKTFEQARQITIPLQVLLQWDDEGNDRQAALDLFDAFGSRQKTLHANMGGHTGVPDFEADEGSRFFARHLPGNRAMTTPESSAEPAREDGHS